MRSLAAFSMIASLFPAERRHRPIVAPGFKTPRAGRLDERLGGGGP